MESKFTMEFNETLNSYMIKEKETGWFYPNLSKLEAETLLEKLNEVSNSNNTERTYEPKLIPFDKKFETHDDFIEYDNLIHWISKTSKRLTEIDEIYKEEFKVELANAMEIGIDFKKIYGGNNEKTRKQYVDEQLSDILDEKKMLKAYQTDDLRRIDFLKLLIQFKIKMVDNKELQL